MNISSTLAQRWPEWKLGETRRAGAAFKRSLYAGTYAGAIKRAVVERIGDSATGAEVVRFVNTAHGLFGVVADTCAVVYQRGIHRELRGVSEPAAKAFADIVAESGLPALGASVNALAWATGPVVVLPFVDDVRGVARLCLETVTQDRCEVRRHRSAPDVVEAVLFTRDDGVFVEVDDEAWHYYNTTGEPLDDGAHDAPHGVGYCPAAVLRAREWLAFDWHGATDHAGLADAAVEVGYLSAVGRWTRTQTSAPLTVITAVDEKFAKLQSLGHPSRPLHFNANPVEARVDVLDRTTDPRHYLSEIQALSASAVARYGIPPSAVSFTNDMTNWGTLSITMTPGALALQRDKQAPLLRDGERALWLTALDVVRASTHRHSRTLPSSADAADSLFVGFPDLADAADTLKRAEAFERLLPHGLASAVEALMTARPELTRAEAEAEIAANLSEYTARIASLAERNVAADPARGVQSIAQLQGREGGIASGETRRAAENDT